MDSTTALAVFQGLMAIVLLGGVPWAMMATAKLARIEVRLDGRQERDAKSDALHNEHDRRLRKIELECATCPLHPDKVSSRKEDESDSGDHT